MIDHPPEWWVVDPLWSIDRQGPLIQVNRGAPAAAAPKTTVAASPGRRNMCESVKEIWFRVEGLRFRV